MSRPKRLPEGVYDAAISEVAAHLQKHLPKPVKGDRTVTRSKATRGIREADVEGRAIFEAETSQLEIREALCRNLIALAGGGDKKTKKQAEVELRVMAIDFLEDVIAGRGNAAAPGVLLRFICDALERSLPYDKDRLHARQIEIAKAVDRTLETVPGIRATRNHESRTEKHRESACSLVAKALVKVGHNMGEDNVRVAWKGVSRG